MISLAIGEYSYPFIRNVLHKIDHLRRKMSEEEFAEDDIWFGSQFRLDESQQLQFVEEDTQVNEIVQDAGVAVNSFAAAAAAAVSLENTTDVPTQFPTDVPREPPTDTEPAVTGSPPAKARAKRNTTSYAKKLLLAGSSFFLDPRYADQYTATDTEVVGQVKQCPRELNGRLYVIEWRNPLPPGLQRQWLRCTFPGSDENKEELLRCIEAYQNSSIGLKKAETRVANRTKKKVSVSISSTGLPVDYIHARSAASSVKTSSTISSLSQNTLASPIVPRRRQTRAANDADSSSDDGEDLDEEDNMYEYDPVDAVMDDSDNEPDPDDDKTLENTGHSSLKDMLDDLLWNFTYEVSVDDPDCPAPYVGPMGLKPGVAASFSNPFECLGACGGLDYDLVTQLTRNSNDFARNILLKKDRNNRLHGHVFKNITTEEMYQFLGITLRISLSPVDWGGYEAYFSANNRHVLGLEIKGTDGFARHIVMTLSRYKQIRSAFHPEDRSTGDGGDKCYQLRHVINTLNQAAANTMHIGENVTFDEGGIGSRHRLNPVRQYNKDKPQKFRVDFFIMACSKSYFIHHIDVYQGANASNVGIHRSIRSMPTTQKAVLNAVLSTGMHQEVQGARHIALDNRYQCPELAFLLRTKFKILSSGTCRKNRKGWNAEMMNLSKSEVRGKYKISVDKDNKILCCQWMDSKVVNVVSSILSLEISKVLRQVGNQKKEIPCPYVITKYQKNMIGVDKSDQMRAAGGGFALKAHYQKWYKRAYFAIFDMMALNALIAWNQSCKVRSLRRSMVKRHEFLWYVAESMLTYTDTRQSAKVHPSVSREESTIASSLDGHAVNCKDPYARCAVCKLDYNIQSKALDSQQDAVAKAALRQSSKQLCTRLAICTKCRITTHSTIPDKKRQIHQVEAFDGLTCFQIAHTKEGYQVWRRNLAKEESGEKNIRSYNPQMTHPICNHLREHYGLHPTRARKRKKINDTTIESEDGEEL